MLVAGFQGVSQDSKDVTTLGRGGSDTTAVALAAALNADVCEIYTDVDGIFTADPRIVPNARHLDTVSFEEMLEMAACGAKVLMLRCVEYARRYDVPIHVRSSYTDKPGTLVKGSMEDIPMEDAILTGVAHDRSEAKVTVVGLPDVPGYAAKVFRAVADADVNIDMVLQNISKVEDGKTDITFTCSRDSGPGAVEKLTALQDEIGFTQVLYDDHIGKVSLIGAGMRSHPGVTATFCEALAEVGVNIDLISTSEIRISVLVKDTELDKAVVGAARGVRPRRRRRGRRVRGNGTLDGRAIMVQHRCSRRDRTGRPGDAHAARRARLPRDVGAVLRLRALAGQEADVPRPGDRGRGRRDRRPDAAWTSRCSPRARRCRGCRRRGSPRPARSSSTTRRRGARTPTCRWCVSEVNFERDVAQPRSPKGIIANPNCTTMAAMPVLKVLHDEAGLVRHDRVDATRRSPAAGWPASRNCSSRPARSSTTAEQLVHDGGALRVPGAGQVRRADRVQRGAAGRFARRRRLRRDRRGSEAAQREPQDPRHPRPAGQRHLCAGAGVHRALAVDQRRVRPAAVAGAGAGAPRRRRRA